MRSATALALAASLLLVDADALSLVTPRDASPKVVSHTIYRNRHIANPIARDRARLARRAGTVNVGLQNEETLYFMNVTIGTPAQDLRLHLDTGSSDLWVNTPSSTFCRDASNDCALGGTYVANDSSTYHYVNSDFNITYVDGSGAVGDYVTDTVRFGGVTLTNQQMGIGYSSSTQEGILGIGYPINEVAVAYNGGQPYSNVPESLVQAGLINANAYSLWLNDLDSAEGSILFGGVNTAKYTGNLKTLPIVPTYGVYAEFTIAMTAVGTNGNAGSVASNLAVGALLDSGTSLMYVPDDIATAIFDATGAKYDSQSGAALIDCDAANSDTTIDFTFSEPTISIAMSELVIIAGYEGNQPICIVGVAPSGSNTAVLGDTFLRSAYVVYDIDKNQISLAQTEFNNSQDDIQEIGTSGEIPGATSVANAVATVSSEAGDRGIGSIGGLPSVSSEGGAMPTAMSARVLPYLGAAGAGLLLAM